MNTINFFFNSFGTTIVIPTTIFIIALFVGYDPKKSLLYGLYAGIGLTGFFMDYQSIYSNSYQNCL